MNLEPSDRRGAAVASDPASSTTADRAVAWAVAVQMGAVAVAWSTLFGTGYVRFSWIDAAYTLLQGASAALAGRFLAPVATRARSRFGAVCRCVGLGVAGGVFTKSTAEPLAHLGSTFAPGMTRFDFFLDDLFVGAVLGFFAGLFAATVVLRHRRLERLPALDRAPRIYLGTATSLLGPTLALALVQQIASSVVLLLAGAGLLGVAGVAFGHAEARSQARDAATQAALHGLASGLLGVAVVLVPFGLLAFFIGGS